MTAPDPRQQILALARLSGLTPDPQLTRDVTMAAMIAHAKQRGLTWRQIGSALGDPDPAAAKRTWKQVARSANSALLASAVAQMQGAGAGD